MSKRRATFQASSGWHPRLGSVAQTGAGGVVLQLLTAELPPPLLNLNGNNHLGYQECDGRSHTETDWRGSRGLQTHSIAAVKIHARSRCPRAELGGSAQAAPASVAGGAPPSLLTAG